MGLKQQAEVYAEGKRSGYYPLVDKFSGDALCEETKAILAAVISQANTHRFTPISQSETLQVVNLAVRVQKAMPIGSWLRSTQIMAFLLVQAGVV